MSTTKTREKMRVSTDPIDQGFRADAYRFEAWLDGVKQPDCITADEEKGLVILVSRDANGNIRKDDNFRALRETRHGRVEVRLKEHGL